MATFMFPGQGSQKVGMGKDLFAAFPDLVRLADDVLGYSIERLCLEDPERQLKLTQFTQPALFTVNALTYIKKMADGAPRPDYLIGHSLGEYDALFAAEAFDFPTGLQLVAKRGELMGKARPGSMAAVVGLGEARTKEVLSGAADDVDVANLNSPVQTVVSGPTSSIDALKTVFERAGARYIPLNVTSAFHSRYMKDAGEEFGRFLSRFRFDPPTVPVISNVTARPHGEEDTARLLAEQITHPVRWCDSVRHLLDEGQTSFEEVGPGRVLTGLVAAIRKQ